MAVVQVARKLQKLKERMIAQGNWPGRAGPRVNTEEEDFKVSGADVAVGGDVVAAVDRLGTKSLGSYITR